MSLAFAEQLDVVSQDQSIVSYFSDKKSLHEFLKTYIQVDKVITGSNYSPDAMCDKLEQIKHLLQNNTTQISSIQSTIVNSQTTLIEMFQNKIETVSSNIERVANIDIKNMFSDLRRHLTEGLENQNFRVILENFKDKIENLNSQNLNDFDRKTLEMLSNIQNAMVQSLDAHTITHKINSIENSLVNINEHFSSNSSKKGQLAEGILFNVLTECLPDTEVVDTSHMPNAGDVQLVKQDKPVILVDSKHFASKTVPKRDLDKFYSDIQTNNCSGILCNAFGGIANKQHFEVDIVDKNVLVFVHSHKFDSSVFALAVNIIYNIHEQIKEKKTDSINIDQRHYQNLKIEYNYYLQSFRHHLDIIKTNVNSLSQLSFNLLDNFFKRKASLNELKSFVCHLCGTGCKTDKILKTHIKKIHNKKQQENEVPPPVPPNSYNPKVFDIPAEDLSPENIVLF